MTENWTEVTIPELPLAYHRKVCCHLGAPLSNYSVLEYQQCVTSATYCQCGRASIVLLRKSALSSSGRSLHSNTICWDRPSISSLMALHSCSAPVVHCMKNANVHITHWLLAFQLFKLDVVHRLITKSNVFQSKHKAKFDKIKIIYFDNL